MVVGLSTPPVRLSTQERSPLSLAQADKMLMTTVSAPRSTDIRVLVEEEVEEVLRLGRTVGAVVEADRRTTRAEEEEPALQASMEELVLSEDVTPAIRAARAAEVEWEAPEPPERTLPVGQAVSPLGVTAATVVQTRFQAARSRTARVAEAEEAA